MELSPVQIRDRPLTNIETLLEENSRQEIDEDTYYQIIGKEVETPKQIDCYMYSPPTIQRLADTLSLSSKPDYVVKIGDESERYFTVGGQHLVDVESRLEEDPEKDISAKNPITL